MDATTGTLKVPGATLYHEVRGHGPVLLVISGGVMDSAVLTGFAESLAGRYTVVTYDRRGNSRSPLDGPDADQDVATHAGDARRLLAGVTDAPAHVLGVSSGGLIALELAARHPGAVRSVVAHEPVAFELLPEAALLREGFDDVRRTARDRGVGPAMEKFAALLDLDEEDGGAGAESGESGDGGESGDAAGPLGEPDPATLEMFARMGRNAAFMLAHEAVPFTRHLPDLDALKALAPRLVIGVGAESEGQLPHRAGAALAARLGLAPVAFPGGHGGFTSRPGPFADVLHRALGG
ncbi:alpha/beta fold hydrolase [Bailinhaonella thermotolerans]|uniref:Alpha/beta fold hydrolase n=1 Tax=Bailinhaonella thermotolerans TaxID=1070861 RepID=A0A3A4ASB3_9ACTN|nr:alpha/beta hydrolase [Bailinhaonella thermotolerans]RJL24208.1 alpha/beta fold hydrolase [Bailinhaonella thermotolerans]